MCDYRFYARCAYDSAVVEWTLLVVYFSKRQITNSGAGTNLKVGTPVRRKSGGRHRLGAVPGNFCGRAPPLFLAIKVQLVVLVSAFVVVSTVWSVSFFAVQLLTVPPSPCPAICKSVGARAPLPYGVGATGYDAHPNFWVIFTKTPFARMLGNLNHN